jgi:prevent-host-death family protein
VREVALAKVKDDLSKYLRLATGDEIVITRHGRPAGVLIGFESDDDWFDYRLEHHPEFAANRCFPNGSRTGWRNSLGGA